jgi:hypothetical protein
MNAVTSSDGIGKIIALVSNKVLQERCNNEDQPFNGMTAFEYFESVVKQECGEGTIILKIRIEDDCNKPVAESNIIKRVCNLISEQDTVYADTAGGVRTISNTMQLLLKILKYKGVKHPYSLYSDIQDKSNCFISTTLMADSILSIADALNEFMTSGKSEQLKNCINSPVEEIDDLLDAMCRFSDFIRLGMIDRIGEVIKRLKVCIDKCKEVDDNGSVEVVILKQFLDVIDKKLIGGDVWNDKSINYCRLVHWCLDNRLVQQAVAIFTEKIPIVLFDKNLMKYYGNVDVYKKSCEKSNNTTFSHEWQANALYIDYLGKDRTDIENVKGFLRSGLHICDSNLCSHVSSVLNRTKHFLNGDKTVKLESEIRGMIEKKNIRCYNAFINSLSNDEKVLQSVFKIGSETDRFDIIRSIEKNPKPRNRFDFTIKDGNRIAKILYGYVYIKHVRNRISHASSEENFTESNKHVLTKYGYTFNADDDLSEISANIELALSSIEDCINEREVVEQTNEVCNVEFGPTKLHKCDVVDALCVAPKVVNIPEHDYNIQLVIPKESGIDAKSIIGKNISVVVKQISTNGKVCQVELKC